MQDGTRGFGIYSEITFFSRLAHQQLHPATLRHYAGPFLQKRQAFLSEQENVKASHPR